MKNLIRSHSAIIFLLCFSFVMKIFSYHDKPLYWDESTYISIGKYLFSHGQIGFIEPFRPIVWPFILGLLWKLHLDVFLIGGLLEILLGIGCIYLVYLIGTKVFNQAVGLLAAVLFSLSSTYHYWNITLLTDIPSTFVGLWAVYLLFNKKYFLSGLIGALAFLSRFTQSLTVDLMFLFLVVHAVRFRQIKPILHFTFGAVCLLVPFFIYNQCMYGNFLAAFIDSKIGYSQYTSPWHEGMLLVLSTLMTNEGWIFIFIFPAVWFIFSNTLKYEALLILSMGIAQFLWIGKLPLEIVRYLIACLPFFYILAALGIVGIYSRFKMRFTLLPKVFLILAVVISFQLVLRFPRVEFSQSQVNEIQKYTINFQDKLKGKQIWISNPTYFTYTDLKIHELMYYPQFNLKKIDYLQSHLAEADYIFLDSTNMRCTADKVLCEVEKWKLIDQIQSDFYEEVSIPSPDPKKIYAVYKNKRLD